MDIIANNIHHAVDVTDIEKSYTPMRGGEIVAMA